MGKTEVLKSMAKTTALTMVVSGMFVGGVMSIANGPALDKKADEISAKIVKTMRGSFNEEYPESKQEIKPGPQ